MLHRLKLKLVIFVVMAIALGNANSGFSQTEKPDNSKAENIDKSKEAAKPPIIYDFDGSIITLDEARQKLDSDPTLTYRESMNDGRPLLQLIKNEKIGKSVAEFSFKTLKERTVDLRSLQGKIVVLNFWYVGCKPCMEEIPILNEIVKENRNNKRVKFYAVTFVAPKEEYADGMKDLLDFLKKTRFDFQISVASRSVLKSLDVRVYPTTVVLNDGKILFYRSSIGKKGELLKAALKTQTSKKS